MQSLQMRWPVASIIGLSMAMMATAPKGWPLTFAALHLGDLFIQRTAGEGHAEHALLVRAVLLG